MREGHLFHKRLVLARQWDIYLRARFESLRTFLPAFFCLGLETKGAKLHPSTPPKKNTETWWPYLSQKLSTSNCTSDFPYILGNLAVFTRIWINVIQKEFAPYWCYRALAVAQWLLQHFTCFVEILSHALYDLPICNTSELHLGWLLTHPIQSTVSENFCEVVSSQHFCNPLPKSV